MASIKKEPIPEKFLSDHLFLLMGQNPLPNYVSALLLTPPDRTATVYLLHTVGENKSSTEFFAGQLKQLLEKKRTNVKAIPHDLVEADHLKISNKIQTLIDCYTLSGKIGLNYTGGTKPMAVHTYRTLSTQLQDVTFSYLDARDLKLYVDDGSDYPVGRSVDVSLEDLARLHGYDLTLKQKHKTPVPALLVKAIGKLYHSAPDQRFQEWKEWIGEQNRRFPDTEDCDDWLAWLAARSQMAPAWPIPDKFATLRDVRIAIDEICGGDFDPSTLAKALGHSNYQQADTATNWLGNWVRSLWLEDLAFLAIQENAEEFKIKHLGKGLKPQLSRPKKKKVPVRNFDLDAAAMIGYRLFAVSCIITYKSNGVVSEVKKHLFEAFVRARQLGGDEARIALVSNLPEDQVWKVRDEIKRDWHAENQIKVFGQNDLSDLTAAFRDWFRENIPHN